RLAGAELGHHRLPLARAGRAAAADDPEGAQLPQDARPDESRGAIGRTAMPIYEKGDVRIHYEKAGSRFPLLVIQGGGLNSTIEGLKTHPFNPLVDFSNEFRVIAADLRNAKGGQSTGPLEADRPWDAYTDDHLGLMDHLGIRDFMV